MKKIWVVQYNNGTADVFNEEKAAPAWPYIDAFDAEDRITRLENALQKIIDGRAMVVDHSTVNMNGKVVLSPKILNAYDMREIAIEALSS